VGAAFLGLSGVEGRRPGIRPDIRNTTQPERAQSRHAQRYVFRDVPERVAALIPVQAGVGKFTATNTVEDDQDDARKRYQE
jgi:hypothetical protein